MEENTIPKMIPAETGNSQARSTVVAKSEFSWRSAYCRYLEDVGSFPLISPEEEKELFEQYRAGDDRARERLIVGNLRLVLKIARDYENHRVPLADLVNEGNIGLMEAVTRFDPSHGCKLSSYACFWIKQRMRKALASSSVVRLPMNSVWDVLRIQRSITQLESELEREPMLAEIALATNLSEKRVAHLQSCVPKPFSLDSEVNHETGQTIGDLLADEDSESPSLEMEMQNESQFVRTALEKSLNKREREILQNRFGFNGGPPRSLAEIGELYALSPERVRQIQNVALRKLKIELSKHERGSLDTSVKEFGPSKRTGQPFVLVQHGPFARECHSR